MTIATEVDSKVVKDAKKQKKKAIHREERFIDACSNIEPLAAAPRMLDEYCMAQNSGIEMIVDDDTAYIRFIEDEEE